MLAEIQPARSVTRAAGRTRERPKTRLARDELLGLSRQLVEVGLERVVVVRLGKRLSARDADRDALCQSPVDGGGHSRQSCFSPALQSCFG